MAQSFYTRGDKVMKDTADMSALVAEFEGERDRLDTAFENVQTAVAAATFGIKGAVDLYANLPDPATLDERTIYVVRQDTGAPSGNGLYWVISSAWAFLDELNLQDANEVPYDNSVSGLPADNVQSAIDSLDSLVDTASSELDTVESRVDTVESELDTAESLITTNATGISTNDSKITTLNSEMDAAESRLDVVESELDTAESLITTNATGISTNDSKITTLNTEMDAAESRLDVVESELDTAESRLDTVESEVDTLDSRVDNLESKADVVADHDLLATAATQTNPLQIADRAGTVATFKAYAQTAAASGESITVDLQKNGSTVLSSVVTIDSAAGTAVQSGVLKTDGTEDLVADDKLAVVYTYTAGGGPNPMADICSSVWIEL